MCLSPTPWISSAGGILVSCDVFLCPVWLSCKSVVRPKGLIGCGFYFLGFENLGTLLLRHGCGPFLRRRVCLPSPGQAPSLRQDVMLMVTAFPAPSLVMGVSGRQKDVRTAC